MEKLSVTYATALFDLAVEKGAADEVLAQAVFLRDTLQDAEIFRAFVHPHISAADKRGLFGSAFSGHVHDNLLNLLYLVIDKNREAFLLPALASLIGMIERFQNKVTASVMSAEALDEGQIATLKSLLSAKLNKHVDVSAKLDPSVISGPYIYVDGYYIDRTVKRQLYDLTVTMKERCGA
jgi:F-type H+-transporting ATPase subunit delta